MSASDAPASGPPPAPAEDPTNGREDSEHAGDAPLFLTVDDEPDINWSLARLIASRGGAVHHALCGEEAIELTRRHRYIGIFVDAKLPDIEGPLLIGHLRRVLTDPYVVLISGYFFRDDPAVEQALAVGLIQAFVAKPFLHAEILALVDLILAGEAQRRKQLASPEPALRPE